MALFAIMRPMTRMEKIVARPRLGFAAGAALAAVAAAPVMLVGTSARANIFEVYGDVYVGGMYGTEPKFNSIQTQDKDLSSSDFFNYSSGGLLGARLGVELLHTDLYLQFDQFFGPGSANNAPGSDLQVMLGWDTTIGPNRWRGILGGYGGLILAFPYTPKLPIDKGQIAWIGAALEGQGGVEYNVNRFLVLQGIATLGYHYMFSGARAIAVDNMGNAESATSHGFHFLFKLGGRFHIGI